MTRKHVLIAYSVAVVLAMVYLPWNWHFVNQGYETYGSLTYAFVWDSSLGQDMAVNYGLVVLEMIGLTVVAGVAYHLTKPDAPSPPQL